MIKLMYVMTTKFFTCCSPTILIYVCSTINGINMNRSKNLKIKMYRFLIPPLISWQFYFNLKNIVFFLLYSLLKWWDWGWDYSSVVVHLPSICKALGYIPSTGGKKSNVLIIGRIHKMTIKVSLSDNSIKEILFLRISTLKNTLDDYYYRFDISMRWMDFY